MQQQRKVFPMAPAGVRKIIVATNIAETSLTIDGVVFVVDPGLFKQKLYNPRTHVDSLLVSPISKASAMQRAGRAGRTRPGKCFRLYTLDTFDQELPESTYPEIIRSNLSSVVLTLKKLGIDDLVHFDFMEPPSPEAMMRALEILHFLGAVDDECDLTPVGRQMVEFPLDPNLARVIISGGERGVLDEVINVAAMLSIPSPFRRPRNEQKWADKAHQAFASGMGDHLSMLSAFNQYDSAGRDKTQFCRDNYLHDRAMKQAESVVKQLRGIGRNLGLDKANKKDPEDSVTIAVRKSFIEGFFTQCAFIEPGGKHYLTVRDLQIAAIHPGSFLKHQPEWVLYHETVVTERCFMRTVSSITPEMLIEVMPRFFHPEQCRLHAGAMKSLTRALPRVAKREAKRKA
jgi:pre-mRNA-splicing factor ATP-dependent RNA helicase DHX15/PRP43